MDIKSVIWWLCVHEYSEILKINQNQKHYQFPNFFSPPEPSMILLLMLYHNWVCLALRSMGIFWRTFEWTSSTAISVEKNRWKFFPAICCEKRINIVKEVVNQSSIAVSRSTIKEFLFRERYNGKFYGICGSVW